jgi:hypothetical protein
MDAYTDHLPQLTDLEREGLRAQVAQERAAGNSQAADMLELLATEGLPDLADCTPWTDVRETMWQRLKTQHNGGRAA